MRPGAEERQIGTLSLCRARPIAVHAECYYGSRYCNALTNPSLPITALLGSWGQKFSNLTERLGRESQKISFYKRPNIAIVALGTIELSLLINTMLRFASATVLLRQSGVLNPLSRR